MKTTIKSLVNKDYQFIIRARRNDITIPQILKVGVERYNNRYYLYAIRTDFALPLRWRISLKDDIVRYVMEIISKSVDCCVERPYTFDDIKQMAYEFIYNAK